MKNNKGIYSVLAAIAIQLTLGIAYIWSVFQDGVAQTLFDGRNNLAALTFSILLATLTIGSVIGGRLAAKYSTRVVVFAGGIILSLGFFLASFAKAEYSWLMWLTYGAMGGIGMGFTYSTTIACAQKWYPHKKGLVTGVIVAALGFGGVIFTPVIESLLKAFGGQGVGEFNTFRVLAAIFLIVCTVGSIFMVNPSEPAPVANAPTSQATGLSTKEMLLSPKYYLVVFTFLLACMGGLMMIGFAKPFAIGKGEAATTAQYAVVAIALFNSVGRLTWGMVSDKLGRINTIIILLAGTALLSLFVNSTTGFMIYIIIGCIGFFYGGLLSNFPSLTADLFGLKNQALNYGFVLLGFGAGAVISSYIAGYYKDIADKAGNISLMLPAFIIASCCAASGIILMLLLKGMSKKKATA